jgi:hypothetical protein
MQSGLGKKTFYLIEGKQIIRCTVRWLILTLMGHNIQFSYLYVMMIVSL